MFTKGSTAIEGTSGKRKGHLFNGGHLKSGQAQDVSRRPTCSRLDHQDSIVQAPPTIPVGEPRRRAFSGERKRNGRASSGTAVSSSVSDFSSRPSFRPAVNSPRPSPFRESPKIISASSKLTSDLIYGELQPHILLTPDIFKKIGPPILFHIGK